MTLIIYVNQLVGMGHVVPSQIEAEQVWDIFDKSGIGEGGHEIGIRLKRVAKALTVGKEPVEAVERLHITPAHHPAVIIPFTHHIHVVICHIVYLQIVQ